MNNLIVPSSLQNINNMILGYPRGLPVAIFGPPREGKSVLCFQESIYLAKRLEGNVLYIDTEGAGPFFFKMWERVLRERFAAKTVQVLYKDLRRIEDILAFLGHKTTFKVTKSGKVETIYQGTIESEFDKIIKGYNIRVVVIDSMSNPLKLSFPGGRMNLPSRADATDIWLGSLHFACKDNNLVALVTHHRSIDPTNPYAEPQIVGGETLAYNFKLMLYLSQRKFKPHSSVRDVHLVRFPNKKEWSVKTQILLTDQGYVDITEEQLVQMAKGKG